MVMEVVQEEMGEGSMQCTDHHFKNGSSPDGICAFCLQEKLGKLVSSSLPAPIFPSSSPSPSFRSDCASIGTTASSFMSSNSGVVSGNDCKRDQNHTGRSKLPFLLSHGKKKKKDSVMAATRGDSDATSIVLQRSKSTATPRDKLHFKKADDSKDQTLQKRGFWSFLYLPAAKHSTAKKTERAGSSVNVGNSISSRETKKDQGLLVVNENETLDQAALDNKVLRSRSTGCGSRSFSGDFFGRVSTGFGDCTLRRVESHREGKSKMHSMRRNSVTGGELDCIKERVKCGGIFSGFMIASSSSTSYWNDQNVDAKAATPRRQHIIDPPHTRQAAVSYVPLC